MDDADDELDRVFAALADRTRRSLLAELMAGDRTVGALAGSRRLTLAAISKHVHILARAGLVTQERDGRLVRCRARPEATRAAGIWMQGVGGFDAEDYDALERLIAGALRACGEPD